MFQINIAGLTIGIDNRFNMVHMMCEGYEADDVEPDFTVSATVDELRAQRDIDDEWCTPAYCETLCIYRHIGLKMLAFDGFLIHGAAVAVDGQGYLFLAKSGVGKTTHVRYWLDTFGDRAFVVNGDKPILRRIDGVWQVCGTPWCGKESLGRNEMVPVKAICFLERGETNVITHAKEQEVIDRIFHQLLMPQNPEEVEQQFALLEDLLGAVPCYRMQCNLQKNAANVAFLGMQ